MDAIAHGNERCRANDDAIRAHARMNSSKDHQRLPAEYYWHQYRMIEAEPCNDPDLAILRHFRAVKALAKHGFASGFSQMGIYETILTFGTPSGAKLGREESRQITQKAVREAYEEWRAVAE
ncbi:hypothetical protein QTI66_15235 [Variovorax sp. J22R133]|uniref:hypothetical protein n=1 Tax=Variovorax brevis TaxID=3053503 RepID=UPI002576B76C|nr:hypothetical protein [Variovorax sp. J22R133]MDM0113512.1 hypothetical protein [Variovorax sp. J22R133]